MIKYLKNFFILFSQAVFLAVCAFLFFCAVNYDNAKPVKAAKTDNISGFAWGDGIGWISFNNVFSGLSFVDRPEGDDQKEYGVTMNCSSGLFSGYAWSENLGWIRFSVPASEINAYSPDRTAGQAKMNVDSSSPDYEKLSGWVRVCSGATNQATCSGSNKTGDWGWIKLSGKGSSVLNREDYPTLTTNGKKARNMDVGDLNKDGYPDVVVGGASGFSVHLNDGDGTFHNFVKDFDSPGSNQDQDNQISVGLADFDNDEDKDLDIAMLDRNSHLLYIFKNDGFGGFDTVDPARAIKITDFNDSNGHQVYMQNDLVVSDLNNDGKPDLAIAHYYSSSLGGRNFGVSVFFNNGLASMFPSSGQDLNTGVKVLDLELFGAKNDGKPDLIVRYKDGNQVRIYKNNGSGNFSSFDRVPNSPTSSDIIFVKSGDVDNNGVQDLGIAVRNNAVEIYKKNNIGSYVRYSTLKVSPASVMSEKLSFIFEDINKDSKQELVVADTDRSLISGYPNDGTGRFDENSEIFSLPVPAVPVEANFADFDQDSFLDLAAVNFSSGGADSLSVFLNSVSPPYSVRKSGNDFTGFAWGGDGIGWVSFNSNNCNPASGSRPAGCPAGAIPTYKVLAPCVPPNKPQTLGVEMNYCYPPAGTATAKLTWDYSDNDGDAQKSYKIQVNANGSIFECDIARDSVESGETGYASIQVSSAPAGASCSDSFYVGHVPFGSSFKFRVKLMDASGREMADWSEWSPDTNLASHAFPSVDFSYDKKNLLIKKDIVFTDESLCYNGAGMVSCYTLAKLSSSPISYEWDFEYNTGTYENPGYKTGSAAIPDRKGEIKYLYDKEGTHTVALKINDKSVSGGICEHSDSFSISTRIKWYEYFNVK